LPSRLASVVTSRATEASDVPVGPEPSIGEAQPEDYVGVLIPGGAKSPALLPKTRA